MKLLIITCHAMSAEAGLLAGPEPKDVGEKLRTAYVDLKNAQIKTMSFLTYLLRSPYAALVRPHQVHACPLDGPHTLNSKTLSHRLRSMGASLM